MELSTASILGSLEDGRYHSCLLTTYSFDPGFMHQRVVPQMRTCGIRNVLALVDGDMLAEAMEQRIDAGQFTHPRYGLWPIVQQHGVFHPKVMLCFGAAHGLLAVGSGNLTHGGHGGNDELWSILRYTPEDARYRSFFGEMLAVMRTWAGDAGDWSTRQLEWAREHSPWLPEIAEPSTIITGDGTVMRLSLSPGVGALRMLKDAVGNRRVQRITVLSPYLDGRGALLSELAELTSGAVRVVVDEVNGAVPPRLPGALVQRLSFHRWSDVQSLHEEGHACALHAKAIVLELADGSELCYQGSANASVAAMGNAVIAAVNAEAGLLLERSAGGFLRRLGLRLQSPPVPYSELHHSVATEPQPPTARDALRLLSIAFTEQQFVVACAPDIPAGTSLKLRDPERLQDHDLPLVPVNGGWRATGEFEHVPTLGALHAPGGTRLSNWQAVQLHELHVRNDPDARARHIESLVDRLELGDDQLLAEIVPYLPLPDTETTAVPNETTRSARNGDPLLGDRSELKPVTGATPYLAWEESVQGSQRAHDTSTVHRVVDVLLRSLHAATPELEEFSEQEADSGTTEGDGPSAFEARRPQAQKTTLAAHKARKRQLLKYISDYQHSLERRLAPLTGTQNMGTAPPIVVVDDDYAHGIILCRMFMHFLLRPTRDGNDEKTAAAGVYLQLQGDRVDDNVLEAVPIAIGSFQLLAQHMVERERSQWTQKRFDRYREHLLAGQLYCICNVDWPEDRMHWFDLLVLNTLVLIDRTRAADEQLSAAFERVVSLRTGDRYQCRSFDANVEEAWEVLADRLPQWLAVLEHRATTPSRDIEPGSYIYNSKLGICLVDEVESYGTDAATLTLYRPGLEWNDELGDYTLRHVFKSNLVLPAKS